MTHLLSFIDPSPQLAPSQPLNPPTPAQTPERLKSVNTAHKSALLVANHPLLVELLRRFFEGGGLHDTYGIEWRGRNAFVR